MNDLPPATPLQALRPDVWVRESWLTFSGMALNTRMTVLRLGDDLLLCSPTPGPVDDATREALAALGTPRWLVAPNEIHTLGLRSFQAAWPGMHTTGCVGHPRRARDVRFDAILGPTSAQDAVPWTASGEVRFHVIGGNAFLHEIALFHVPTRTLILADAIENFDPTRLPKPPGALVRATMSWSGFTPGQPCMSPEHYVACVDADALAASLAVLEGWAPESIVLCHGDLLEGEAGRAALRDAFGRAIAAARARWAVTRCLVSVGSRFG